MKKLLFLLILLPAVSKADLLCSPTSFFNDGQDKVQILSCTDDSGFKIILSSDVVDLKIKADGSVNAADINKALPVFESVYKASKALAIDEKLAKELEKQNKKAKQDAAVFVIPDSAIRVVK